MAGPIGIFDSGIGGLTVYRALRARLPYADLVYLGDTARVPYGTKSPEVIRRYALRCAHFLVDQGAELVVIACNTASAAVALGELKAALGRPVVGVIEPGAALAAATTSNRRVGVIGTEGTIASFAYQRAISSVDPRIEVFARPCPLFVPLAEEGMVDHPATRLIAQEYLHPLATHHIDTLVLGCTHYPLLAPLIGEVMGSGVHIINSADAVAASVEAQIGQTVEGGGTSRFYATDVSQRLHRVARTFLGTDVTAVDLVDL